MQKTCSKCGSEEVAEKFARHTNICKPCRSAQMKLYYEQHRARIIARVGKWQKENREAVAKKHKAWRAANPERSAEYERKSYAAFPGKHHAKNIRRKAKVSRATPAWANDFFIAEIYDLAALRTRHTGVKWHVDHIVPLVSPLVCGLHCEANLRVITKSENCSKGNRRWPDMPMQGAA